jgi:hypothetical protein
MERNPLDQPRRRPVQLSDFQPYLMPGGLGTWLHYRCPHCGQRDGPFRDEAHVNRVLSTTKRLCFYYNCPGGE